MTEEIWEASVRYGACTVNGKDDTRALWAKIFLNGVESNATWEHVNVREGYGIQHVYPSGMVLADYKRERVEGQFKIEITEH